MGCLRFHPLISRYLDDDLDGDELEECLRHLSGCAACHGELKSWETMRSWFAAAGLLDPVPEPKHALSLSRLLSLEESEPPERAPLSVRVSGQGRAGGLEDRGAPATHPWREKLAGFFSPGAPRNLWRYALPVVALGMLAFWLYPGKTGGEIDVRRLVATRSIAPSAAALNDLPEPNLDLYLIQHAAQQPWTQVGSEISLVRQASAQSTR